MLVSFWFNVTLLVFASSVRVKGVVGGVVVLGLRKTTVVCVILAVVGSVEEIIVKEEAVDEMGVVVVRTVVVMGVVVVRTVVVIVVVDDRSVVPVVETVVRLVVRLVVTRGVDVVALGVVKGRITGLVVRAFIVTGKGRGVAGVVERMVILCVVVFGLVGRMVVRLVTGGRVVVLTVVRLVVEVDVLRPVVEGDVMSK
jgi:hypothetical protein